MLDNIKLRTYNQDLISLFLENGDFSDCKALNSTFQSKSHQISEKIKIHFRKNLKTDNEFVYVDLSISPHYHFNNYRHNGNDFSVKNCIKTLREIMHLIGVKESEMQDFQVVNLEFGVNIIPKTDVKEMIHGVSYYKKTPFKHTEAKRGKRLETSKILNATAYKQIKIYAKGIQCHETLNAPEIDINTLRFEIKSKKGAYLKKLGVYSLWDLFKDDVYARLGRELKKDFDQILILYPNADLSPLNDKEKQFVKKANKVDFWNEILADNYRNKHARYRKKYTEIMKSKKIKHAENLHQKISEKIAFLSGANSTHKNTENKEVINTCNVFPTLIKVEFAPLYNNPIVKHLNNMINFEERKRETRPKGSERKKTPKKSEKIK